MKKKPNIIFIITDDQGAWAVESETNHDIKTPNLTRLAAQGTTFDEFYCTSPVCSPARASIVDHDDSPSAFNGAQNVDV